MGGFKSKLPNTKTSIFAIMSGMAKEHNAINLSQGYPDFPIDPKLALLVAEAIKNGHNQYAPMPGVPELRQALTDKMNASYGSNLDPNRNITVTAGATQAIFNSLNALVGHGDEVIVFDPAYDCYVPGIVLSGATPKPIAIKGPSFRIPWDQVEDAMSEKTKLMIITNPHNPLGKVLRPYDIEAIRRLQEKYDFYILWDEVYEHLIYNGMEHLSGLKYPDLFEKSLITYSFGKTFHATGWKMGYVVGPEYLIAEFKKVHQFSVFSANTPIQHALAEYLKDASNYNTLSSFYQSKRDIMKEVLDDTPFRSLPCEGSYFMLADYSAFSTEKDTDVAAMLARNYGVATIPLSPFYEGEYSDTVLRFCFAKKEETLRAAGEKLKMIKA